MTPEDLAEDGPLTGADLDRWTVGYDDVTAAVANVIGGLDLAELAAWRAGAAGFLTWRPPREPRDAAAVAALDDGRLAWPFDTELSARYQPPAARLAVTGNVVPTEVLPRLQACPGLGSAILPVVRPPGALRRRPWHWPLRIGVLDDALRDAFAAVRGEELPPELVDVRDVRTDPGGVDLLMVRGTPERVAALVAGRRQVANAVLCVGEPGGPWPAVDAHLALLRATTAAIATAVVPPAAPEEVARRVLRTLRALAHAHPFDVALTAGFDRRVLLAGELAALADSDLPSLVRRRARQLRLDLEGLPMAVGAEPPLDELEALPDGRLDAESHEASRAPELDAEVEAALAQAAVPRFLQVLVGPAAGLDDGVAVGENVLRPGPNAVDVFVGPEEHLAVEPLRGPQFPDAEVFRDPTLERVRLTVVLVPLLPQGEPVRAELDVPRTGRSPAVRLLWTLPGRGRVQARLLVLHRNRLIQTAVLAGRVGGPARLRERLVLWGELARLDDRQPFDRTFVLNHDDAGTPAVVSHADGETTIEAMDEIEAVADRIRDHLRRATALRSVTSESAVATAREILIDVAIEGNDLFVLLERHLGRLGGARRLQVVTARSGRFLPLEMVYDRPAPESGARVCENWLAGRECGPHCFADTDPADPDDTSVVCPAVFWGMSRVIERHHTSLTEPEGTAFLVTTHPTHAQRRLGVTRAVLAASDKVDPADVDATKTMLRVPAERVTSWRDWRDALARAGASPADLLVLMPHTDPAVASLEISADTRRRGQIEKAHVTGGREVHPLVVLFGCDTAGSDEDPAGYATRFMAKGAAAVFSTLTMLLNTHAAALSQQLAGLLVDPGRAEQPLGELVARFRRDAVRGGLVSALSVTAYGDADWTV